jgi:3-phenylpropionate/cinnamic acid dioxygenase small subunit
MSNVTDWISLQAATQFIFAEARLQDDHRYVEWESLWDDDGVYWIPANGDDSDPEQQMSIVYDNRSRIAIRVKQLMTGKRHSQTPVSRVRRVLGNVEWLGEHDGCIELIANAIVFESASRGEVIWASRNTYKLRRHADGFKLVLKKVALVNNDKAMLTLSFLI